MVHLRFVSAIALLFVILHNAQFARAQLLTGGWDREPGIGVQDSGVGGQSSGSGRQEPGRLTGYDEFSDDDYIDREVLAEGAPQPSVQVFALPGAQDSVRGTAGGEAEPVVRRPLTTGFQATPSRNGGEPVDLQADDLSFDEGENRIVATGNVILEQEGRRLRADQVRYDLTADRVYAEGHVELREANGDVYLADAVELRDKMKDGMVEKLEGYMLDGSRFTAEEGERTGGNVITMHDASYTACEACESDPDAPPAWGIRAAEVTHDKESQTISYKHARFEAAGVPVLYLPYLSHPDGTVERKSGFLSPSAGFKSNLGGFVSSQYYWDIAPEKDMTVGVTAFTEENPLLVGQWRQRWEDTSLEIGGGVTYSERTDSRSGNQVPVDDELRGHAKAEGLLDINDKWRSGLRIDWASDDQYLRQYNLDHDDILENELYAERFSGRDYAVGRLLTFQDTRVGEDRQQDQPQVLPEIIARFVGEPGDMPVVKGRWSADMSLLGLRRDGNGQDVNRLSADLGWKRRMVSRYGMLTDVSMSARGDFYNTRERDLSVLTPGSADEVTEARFFPQAHVQSSYPMAREFEDSQWVVEPIAAATVAPNIDVNKGITNEDSQDVQIDASNLFAPSRFPGLDRLEDRSRVTYGVRTGVYGFEGSQGEIFLGQSRQLDDDDNPFPQGSGLDHQSSDIVGQISGRYKDRHYLNYRFQLDDQNYASQRHEVDSGLSFGRLNLETGYLFAKALGGTNIDESREQLRMDVGYKFTPEWGLRGGGTQDLGTDPGLRRSYAAIDYFGQCFSWSLVGNRNLTDDSSGESDTEVFLRIGLKNLGEFETSGIQISREE